MEEKDETVERLRKELAALTKPSKRELALQEYEGSLLALVEVEKKLQELQQAHQAALQKLQRVLAGMDEK
jgi:hypothetical protein